MRQSRGPPKQPTSSGTAMRHSAAHGSSSKLPQPKSCSSCNTSHPPSGGFRSRGARLAPHRDRAARVARARARERSRAARVRVDEDVELAHLTHELECERELVLVLELDRPARDSNPGDADHRGSVEQLSSSTCEVKEDRADHARAQCVGARMRAAARARPMRW